jgi:hypothetical protein
MPSRFGVTYSGPTEWLCRVREKREHWNAVRQWPIAKVRPAEIEIVRSQGYAGNLYVKRAFLLLVKLAPRIFCPSELE